MATPVVSGAVALLLQSNPALTPDQVKAKLMLTSYKTFPASSVATDAITGLTYVSNYDVFTVGSGYLDIKAALADKTKFSGTSLSPVATYNSIAKTSTVVCAASTVCAARATNTMWGANTMWGGQYHVGSQHGRCRRGD
jgi:serine protease AprX